MFQLLILTENIQPIENYDAATTFSCIIILMGFLFIWKDEIEIFFRKKPLDYYGFKPGDKVTIKYELLDEWGSCKTKIIYDTILDFKYNRKKEIYLIALLNYSHFIEPWTIVSIKRTKPKVNHLPSWL